MGGLFLRLGVLHVEERCKESESVAREAMLAADMSRVTLEYTHTTERYTVALELSDFFRMNTGLFSLDVARRNDVHADSVPVVTKIRSGTKRVERHCSRSPFSGEGFRH